MNGACSSYLHDMRAKTSSTTATCVNTVRMHCDESHEKSLTGRPKYTRFFFHSQEKVRTSPHPSAQQRPRKHAMHATRSPPPSPWCGGLRLRPCLASVSLLPPCDRACLSPRAHVFLHPTLEPASPDVNEWDARARAWPVRETTGIGR
jgi:hypothetical protein